MMKINPPISIRTTLITGHPGEKEEDFNEMYEFIILYKVNPFLIL